jgi:hypothetical protein
MAAVARYLYQIQTSAAPLRVTNLEIRPRREATDDLTMILSLTSIYLAPETRPGIGGSAASPRPAAARPVTPAAESAAATHPSPDAPGRRP